MGITPLKQSINEQSTTPAEAKLRLSLWNYAVARPFNAPSGASRYQALEAPVQTTRFTRGYDLCKTERPQ